jgi:hypothetical protein
VQSRVGALISYKTAERYIISYVDFLRDVRSDKGSCLIKCIRSVKYDERCRQKTNGWNSKFVLYTHRFSVIPYNILPLVSRSRDFRL